MSIAPGLRQEGSAPAQHPQIIYIGSVSVSSGHRVDLLPSILHEVQKIVSNVTLQISGDGDDVVKLKKEFAHRGLEGHVTWTGRFALSEVEHLLADADVIIDPIDDSIANRAKSSYRVALATALGLPVVTSNIGIRPELIPANLHSKFFAESGDTKSYAEKIAQLLKQPLTHEERAQLTRHAATYTWDNLGKRYCEILTL